MTFRPRNWFLLLGLTALLAGCAETSNNISGTISMPAALQSKLGESDALYIVARKANGGPRPLAVQRMVGMTFPVHYTLSQEDVLMPGELLQGKVEMQAIIRRSGVVSLQVPGDMSGSCARNPVAVGDQHADLTIDHLDH